MLEDGAGAATLDGATYVGAGAAAEEAEEPDPPDPDPEPPLVTVPESVPIVF